jgi:hypothetical protein
VRNLLASAKGFLPMEGRDRSVRIGFYRHRATIFIVLADGPVETALSKSLLHQWVKAAGDY